MQLICGQHALDLTRPQVMGILNVTPDSFSDGGQFIDPQRALEHARQMVADGAVIIDIGGESTRPGANSVSLEEELRRVVPLVEALAGELPVPVSVDTSKPAVMQAAVKAGAGMLNDVYGLRQPGALEAAAEAGVPVCIMHMLGEPRSMQSNPQYQDVARDVQAFLLSQAQQAEKAGVRRENIVLDPGFGFGKTLEHNLLLLKHLDVLAGHGYPILTGMSRKRMIGSLLGDVPVDERLQGSVAAAMIAAMKGARIVRVHDVKETVETLKIVAAVENA